MSHVFRTTTKYWINNDAGVFVLSCIAGGVSIYFGVWQAAVLLLFLEAFKSPKLRRLWEARLEIDEQCLKGNDEDGEPVRIEWKEILYISLLKEMVEPFTTLFMGVGDEHNPEEITIPIHHFDHQRIWELVNRYAPPAALAKNAHRGISVYQEIEKEKAEFVRQLSMPLVAKDAWWFRIVCLLLCLFFILFPLLSPWEEDKTLGNLFTIFILLLCFGLGALFGYAFLTTGSIEVDQIGLTRKVLLGHFYIRWDEVTHVLEGIDGSILFCGKGKYLGVFSQIVWSGIDRRNVAAFIDAQIYLRKIEIKKVGNQFSFAKNTRIKKS